jgi:hypothetical protein
MVTFVTAINCMDGRVQIPIIYWMKKEYKVGYVDMITEPGPIKILSENTNATLINSIKQRVKLSVTQHKSNIIAIIGHHDCTGNPVDKDTQIAQLRDSVKLIESWNLPATIISLWVDKDWIVHKI